MRFFKSIVNTFRSIWYVFLVTGLPCLMIFLSATHVFAEDLQVTNREVEWFDDGFRHKDAYKFSDTYTTRKTEFRQDPGGNPVASLLGGGPASIFRFAVVLVIGGAIVYFFFLRP